MDLNVETRQAHKRDFMDFFDQDRGQGLYMDKIRSMISAGKTRLLVDLHELRRFNRDLAQRLMRQPLQYLQPMEDALQDTVDIADPTAGAGADKEKGMAAKRTFHVGFEGPFGSHRLTPRSLLADYLGMLVCVEGIVTKCSLVRPKVVQSVHFCPQTHEFVFREYRDVTSLTGLPTGSVYPTRDDQGNLLVTEFGLSKYIDHQAVSIQELPENSPPGQLPRSIDVIVEDDLVDLCKPGDRVQIYGAYRAVPTKGQGSMSGTFRTVLVANNVVQLNKSAAAPIYTKDELDAIKKLGVQPDSFDLLAESLAPSIYGHLYIKKAALLLLLGGMEKNLANGTHIRGDLNMLMVGDPSVAKSQILRAVMNIAPLAISTTGRGSSGVGLTAAVTTDIETGDRRLEAGAMVLADRGIVCIDEFDKMSDLDRVAIHEVMEQQTVTIAKAGIHCSLNARCSVVAAANPVWGKYNHNKSPHQNIGLPDSLLSRFDLLFIVLDQIDPDIDRRIADHVLRMHRFRDGNEDDGLPDQSPMKGGGAGAEYDDDDDDDADAPADKAENEMFVKFNRLLHGGQALRRQRGADGRQTRLNLLTPRFLKKYIHYAKDRVKPTLTSEAAALISSKYSKMRQEAINPETGTVTTQTLPITARTLETLIRLSTAVAKMRLSNRVREEDVQLAIEVVDYALYCQDAKDARKVELDEDEERRRDAAERKRKGPGGGSGGRDDDEGGDGGSDGAAPPPRRRQRSDATPDAAPTGDGGTAAPAAGSRAHRPSAGQPPLPGQSPAAGGRRRGADFSGEAEQEEEEPLVRRSRRTGAAPAAAVPSQAQGRAEETEQPAHPGGAATDGAAADGAATGDRTTSGAAAMEEGEAGEKAPQGEEEQVEEEEEQEGEMPPYSEERYSQFRKHAWDVLQEAEHRSRSDESSMLPRVVVLNKVNERQQASRHALFDEDEADVMLRVMQKNGLIMVETNTGLVYLGM